MLQLLPYLILSSVYISICNGFLLKRSSLSGVRTQVPIASKQNVIDHTFSNSLSVVHFDADRNTASLQFALSVDEIDSVVGKCCNLLGHIAETSDAVNPLVLFNSFGAENINSLCCELLLPDLLDKCKLARIPIDNLQVIKPIDFVQSYSTRRSLDVTAECNFIPDVQYEGDSYKGLLVEVKSEEALVSEKIHEMKTALLRERAVYSEVREGDEEQKQEQESRRRYQVKQGDCLLLRVEAYPLYTEETDVGEGGVTVIKSRGEKIRKLSRDKKRVRVVPGGYYEEVLRQLVGKRRGDRLTVDLNMLAPGNRERHGGAEGDEDEENDEEEDPEIRSSGVRGVAVSLDIEVLQVREMRPAVWNNALADSVQQGMTLRGLEALLKERASREVGRTKHLAHWEAAEKALWRCIKDQTKIPAGLLECRLKKQFKKDVAEWMTSRSSGSSSSSSGESEGLSEDLDQCDPALFERYAREAGSSVERRLQLELAYRDILLREGLKLDQQEAERRVRKSKELALATNSVFDEPAVREDVVLQMTRQAVLTYLLVHSTTTTEMDKEEEEGVGGRKTDRQKRQGRRRTSQTEE